MTDTADDLFTVDVNASRDTIHLYKQKARELDDHYEAAHFWNWHKDHGARFWFDNMTARDEFQVLDCMSLIVPPVPDDACPL